MKSVLLATSLMAVLASSTPLEKRYYVTETDTYTVTVTETGSGAEATGGWGGWGNWGQWSTPADPAAPATTATSDAWVASSYSTPAAAAATTPATTTTSAAAAAWSSSSASSSVSSYAQAILDQHNNHRSNHSANPLVWDDNLANTAQTIGQSCVYAHDT
jgi:hypothetical protein